MNKFLRYCSPLLIACLPIMTEAAAPQAPSSVSEISQQVFLDRNGAQIGSRRLEVVRDGDALSITEDFTVRNPFGEFGWKATVVYQTKPRLMPVSGTSQTFANGKPVLKGNIRIADGKLHVKAVGKSFDGPGVNRPNQEPLPNERTLERNDFPLVGTHFIFTTGLSVAAPLLAPRDGEVEDVTILEFPDDIGFPEVIETKSGGSLKRFSTPDGKVEILLLRKDGQSRESAVYASDESFLMERQSALRFEPAPAATTKE